MSKQLRAGLLLIAASIMAGIFVYKRPSPVGSGILAYRVNPVKQPIKLYWQDDQGQNIRSLQNLKDWLASKNEKLVFAMNGGMYRADNSSVGLFIQEQKVLSRLDTGAGRGNFYLQPNGIFFIRQDNSAAICKTEDFAKPGKVKYATQSGPMLVVGGRIHPAFKPGSKKVNIRNGVGLLPNGDVVFAMSKKEISFYDFASYFRKLGCQNALYLDGLVSRTYLPEQGWEQLDGDFGVIIGVTTPLD
jgi:uncharacterized protein YigE (DUF2233 family)